MGDQLQHEADNDSLDKLYNRLLHLYQGPFLQHMDSEVMKEKQQQLHNKITHLIERLITYYEGHRDHKNICRLLEQNPDRIPQLESKYQALITSQQKN